jgi:hypothetical protein
MACFQVLVSCCWSVYLYGNGDVSVHSLADVLVLVVIVFVMSMVFQIGKVSKPWCD